MTGMRRGWFHLATGAGVGRVLGFLSNLLLSRWLGPTQLGLFNLVTTTVQTSDTLVRCGGDYALNYELGDQPQATKTKRGAELARALAQLCSLATVLICIAVLLWVWWGKGLFPIGLSSSKRLFLTALLICMIACEGICASAWEVLLVSHRTIPLALRHGLFVPMRLLLSAAGALHWGVSGAMVGWTCLGLAQCFWLRRVLGHLWNPFYLWPILLSSLRLLLSRGMSFYFSNLVSSIIFYPLLLQVSSVNGLAEVGYLRVGQILQQLFAFLPSTFVPVLFLRLRKELTLAAQVSVIERPLRITWLLLLEILLLYFSLDRSIINWVFGGDFLAAIIPTRLLLITALLECLSQLLSQPLLATGITRRYAALQNGAALFSAVLGWIWIPKAGVIAYLVVRLVYVLIPLLGFAFVTVRFFHVPSKLLYLMLLSISLAALSVSQISSQSSFGWMSFVFPIMLVITGFIYRYDIDFLIKQLKPVSRET